MLSLTIGSRFDLNVVKLLLSSKQKIGISFFGAPPHFSLDGGRIVENNVGDFNLFITGLKKLEVPFNLCCNTTLNSDQLTLTKETWRILEQAYSPLNGVIVSRYWLAEKIKNRFPDYKLTFSSIGAITEKWDESHLFSEFDVVVCPVEKLNNFTFLKNQDNWHKLEIFLNNECIGFGDNCIKHYQFNSEVNAELATDTSNFICPNIKRGRNKSTNIQPTFSDITKYMKMGVTRFKVIERTSLVQNYQHYITLLSQANS
jgi:collagenase-like PrtC family protease